MSNPQCKTGFLFDSVFSLFAGEKPEDPETFKQELMGFTDSLLCGRLINELKEMKVEQS
jgi:hypothetical protein